MLSAISLNSISFTDVTTIIGHSIGSFQQIVNSSKFNWKSNRKEPAKSAGEFAWAKSRCFLIGQGEDIL